MNKFLVILTFSSILAQSAMADFVPVKPVNGSVLGALLAKKIPAADPKDTTESHLYNGAGSLFFIGTCPVKIEELPEGKLVNGSYSFQIPNAASQQWYPLELNPETVVYAFVDKALKVEKLTVELSRSGSDSRQRELIVTHHSNGQLQMEIITWGPLRYSGREIENTIKCGEGL
jgi:hypothetical protein